LSWRENVRTPLNAPSVGTNSYLSSGISSAAPVMAFSTMTIISSATADGAFDASVLVC
jgi:hypothetical protein